MADDITCPKCKKITRNIADIRQQGKKGISIISVGYECEHCGKKFGHLSNFKKKFKELGV